MVVAQPDHDCAVNRYGTAMAPQTAAKKFGAGVNLEVKSKEGAVPAAAVDDDALPAATPAATPAPTPAPTPTDEDQTADAIADADAGEETEAEAAARVAAEQAAAAAAREADADDEARVAFLEAQALEEELAAEEADEADAAAAALETVDAAEAALGDGVEVVDAKTDDGERSTMHGDGSVPSDSSAILHTACL